MIVSNASSEIYDVELSHPAKSAITVHVPFPLKTIEKISPPGRHADTLLPMLAPEVRTADIVCLDMR